MTFTVRFTTTDGHHHLQVVRATDANTARILIESRHDVVPGSLVIQAEDESMPVIWPAEEDLDSGRKDRTA